MRNRAVFSLAQALLSGASADDFPPLFGPFAGNTEGDPTP